MKHEGYWFRSSMFALEPGEDRETNPGVFGRRLAHWMADCLRARGYRVDPPRPEDWGWYVRCAREGGPALLVGCGNVMDAEDEGEAPGRSARSVEDVVWHCFAALHRPVLAHLFHRAKAAQALHDLDAAVREALTSEPAIAWTEPP